MIAANWTFRILPQLQFSEAQAESIKEQQAPDQRFTLAQNQLQSFHRLNAAHDSGKHAKHSALGTRRYKSRRGRLGIQAAVTRPARIANNARLAFKAEK